MIEPPTFAIPSGSFLGLGRADAGAPFVIAGIPLDLGTTNRAGARDGPRAIRAASRMLVDGMHPHWWFDPKTMSLSDIGDFQIALGDITASFDLIERQAAPLAHLIALGGEHGVSLPLLRALRLRTGEKLGLLHFDSHCDMSTDNFGQVYGHGTVFYHAIKEGLIDPARTIQIGIRAPMSRAMWDWTIAQGVTILPAEQAHESSPDEIAEQIKHVLGPAPSYFSFDIDSLDPSCAPGTGTPEIGGLLSWQAQAIIRRLAGVKFVGADVVEVLTTCDVSEITALAAATIAWEYLCLLGANR